MHQRAQALIDSLGLLPHVEGGYYRELYRAGEQVASPVHHKKRACVTLIYFLLLAGQKSRLHHVCHDEIWHFYEGAPLVLLDVATDVSRYDKIILGKSDLPPCYTHCVSGGHIQAAYSAGAYTLAGCVVAPGFDFHDFMLLEEDAVQSQALLTRHPELEPWL